MKKKLNCIYKGSYVEKCCYIPIYLWSQACSKLNDHEWVIWARTEYQQIWLKLSGSQLDLGHIPSFFHALQFPCQLDVLPFSRRLEKTEQQVDIFFTPMKDIMDTSSRTDLHGTGVPSANCWFSHVQLFLY